jgi:hypothetical protein
MLDWVASGTYLLKGEVGNFLSVLKAQGAVIKNLGLILKKRKQLRDAYPDYSKSNIYHGLILFKYLFGQK